MNIRYARPQETELIRRLWIEGFGDAQPYTDWYFRQVYRPERTLCLWEGREMAASLQLAPYRLQLNGHIEKAAYLVGVVTSSAYRSRGFGKALLNYALNQLKQSGYKLAMLYTDIPEFYTSLGFCPCYQLRRQLFTAENAPLPEGWRLSKRRPEDLARCDKIYRSMTQSWNGYILRSPENWRNFTDDFLCDGGELWLSQQGYLLWFPEQEQLHIHELGYSSAEALSQALTLARSLCAKQGLPTVSWNAPLPTPRLGKEAEIKQHVMCRRLDLPDNWLPEAISEATLELYRSSADSNWVNELT